MSIIFVSSLPHGYTLYVIRSFTDVVLHIERLLEQGGELWIHNLYVLVDHGPTNAVLEKLT